jgi:hypothetical protein
VDTVAERALASGKSLPAKDLEAFIRQKGHAPAARRLAYEWLAKVDATTADRLLPGMLNDPSLELRRDAVARVAEEAQKTLKKGDRTTAKETFARALAAARDKDQVQEMAKQLEPLGISVDLPTHFGFVQQWLLLGPFDNTGEKGFGKVYQPEQAVTLAAPVKGKNDVMMHWKEHRTADPFGLVDLNKILGKQMAAVAYAYTVIDSALEQPVEIRTGSDNALRIFLNGKQIFFREEYHHGIKMDQHVGQGMLRPGRNEILVKVCQNNQTEEWAQSWSFQLRVCDALGGRPPWRAALPERDSRNPKGSKNEG